MHESERIVVDARLTGVISIHAFRAELANGHTLVVVRRANGPASAGLGDVVKVRLSPYDMAVGEWCTDTDGQES